MSTIAPQAARRRRMLIRSLPIAAISLAAFIGGVVVGARVDPDAGAKRFANAWERQDFAAMYAELSPAAQEAYPLEKFTELYVDAQATATAIEVVTDEVKGVDTENGHAAAFDASVDTHAFGQINGRMELPLDDEDRVAWEPHLVMPGLRSGETLGRRTNATGRAAILARDGTPLASGPTSARTSPLGASALAIAGSIGTPSRKQEHELYALGFPEGTIAGVSGLELAFNERLAGQPSGELFALPPGTNSIASGRVLATGKPLAGKPVHTTIDPDLQRSAVAALGGTYGGVAVLDAQTGAVRAVAGLAYSSPQPPGSTFKILTSTAALEANAVKMTDTFPVVSSNSEIGREIANAHDELCGGTFVESFAHSCNTVFAPLGVRVGGELLAATALRYGFNSPPALVNEASTPSLAAPESQIPTTFENTVAVGESAIGQGKVLATPLQMASVAQTVANDGKRLPTALVTDPDLAPDETPVKVMSADTAAKLQTLMRAVVAEGTGIHANLPGITVAGKTGTAELGPAPNSPDESEASDQVDAWFTAFAPVDEPKLAVAAMVVNTTEDGGTVAAPIVASIIDQAL